MPWFAIDTDLEGNEKVHAFALARSWSIERTLVFFYRFLRTVRLHAPDGDVTLWDDRYLGRMTDSPRSSGLIADLTKTGFLDANGVTVVVHDWEERNGRWIADAARKRRERHNRNGLAENVRHFAADSPTPSRARAVEHEPEHEPESNTRPTDTPSTRQKPAATRPEPDPEGFARFFKAYPRRDGRRAAAKEFAHALRRHPDLSADDLHWAAQEYARQLSNDPKHEPRYTPMPRTWLSHDRFLEYFEEGSVDA